MKWKFANFCSRKFLSGRQHLLLTGAVTASVAALAYTYFTVEYVLHATMVSVADSSPHVRIVLPPEQSHKSTSLAADLVKEDGVIRCDVGVMANSDWHIAISATPEGSIREKALHHANVIPIQWTGYAFDHEKYRPPALIENVYASDTRRRMEQAPLDEPIIILDDMREQERKENWVIVNRHFSSLFPAGFGSFVDPFEVSNPRWESGTPPVVCRVAGVTANSPFDIGISGKRYVLYTRRDIVEKIAAPGELHEVIDIALAERADAEMIAERLKTKWGFDTVTTWMNENKAALPFIRGIRLSAYSGMAAVAFLSICGVGIAIVMTIEDRKKQLATLFAMGMNAMELRLVFVFAGARLVFMSSLIGLALAYVLAKASLSHWEGLMRNFFHPHQSILVFDAVSLIGMCLSLALAAIATSWFASRSIITTDPVACLR